jgi:hypothetical protein
MQLCFFEKISSKLQEWGFVINPCNWCVFKNNVDRFQCTIVCYVDNLKISHVKASVVSDAIKQVEEVLGKESPMSLC